MSHATELKRIRDDLANIDFGDCCHPVNLDDRQLGQLDALIAAMWTDEDTAIVKADKRDEEVSRARTTVNSPHGTSRGRMTLKDLREWADNLLIANAATMSEDDLKVAIPERVGLIHDHTALVALEDLTLGDWVWNGSPFGTAPIGYAAITEVVPNTTGSGKARLTVKTKNGDFMRGRPTETILVLAQDFDS